MEIWQLMCELRKYPAGTKVFFGIYEDGVHLEDLANGEPEEFVYDDTEKIITIYCPKNTNDEYEISRREEAK